MKIMIDLMRRGQPAADVMDILSSEEQPFLDAVQRSGRNEPCPCGSGRKLKYCHGAPQSQVPARPMPDELGTPRAPVTERGKRAAARAAMLRPDRKPKLVRGKE
jgi:hypothetical protein